MADIRKFVKNVFDEYIKEKYPHARNPAAMYAKITDVKETENGYEYRLKVLDRNGNVDETVAEIPCIRSDQQYMCGEKVTILLMYGLMLPYIVGRCTT